MSTLKAPKGGGRVDGVLIAGIDHIEDVTASPPFPGQELFWRVDFTVEGAKYPVRMDIFGIKKKNADGEVIWDDDNWKEQSLVKQMTWFMDGIGLNVGMNPVTGEWNDNDTGDVIEDIYKIVCMALGLDKQGLRKDPLKPPSDNCCIYVYQKWNKKKGRCYTTVWNKVYPLDKQDEMQKAIDTFHSEGKMLGGPPAAVAPSAESADADW